MDNVLPVDAHKLESLIGAIEPVQPERLRSFMRYLSSNPTCDEDRSARIHISENVTVAIQERRALR